MLALLTRIDRYIAREICVPFAFSVAFVVFVVFLFQMQRLATAAVGFGLHASDVLVILVAALPPFLVLAIPIAFLLSVLIGMGRLAGDLELTALRAAGATPWALARVPLILGAIVSVLCVPVAMYGEPYGLNILYERLIDVSLRNITSAIQPGVFNTNFRGLALYAAGTTDDGRLSDVLLFDERDRAHPVLILASVGSLDTHGGRDIVMTLEDGEMHLGAGTDDTRYDRIRFDRAQFGIDTERELYQRTRFISDIGRMTPDEMLARAADYGPEHPVGRRIEKTYWRRFAFPSMALIFGLIAAAIALSSGATSRARNAVLAIGAIVGYYVLTRVGDWATLEYAGTPLIAAFGPNLLVLAIGVVALARSGRPQ